VTILDGLFEEARLRVAKAAGAGSRTLEKLAPRSRWLLSLLSLMVLPGVGQTKVFFTSQSEQSSHYTIKVNVDMVVLHATVQDHKRDLVSGLGKDHFQVYEDGVLQAITYFSHEDIPITVGLVIDNSGSMGPKRSDVIAAALAFARSSNADDQMFVVNFNEHVSFGLPAGTLFTDRRAQLEVALSRIAANGETALYDALAIGLEHLKKGNRDKKVLIVISDGGDNASAHNLAQIMAMAGQSDAIIYTVGLFDENDPDRNARVLKQLAHATGGEAFLPTSLEQVGPICEQIAHDIRNQYTIAYVPTNRQVDGTYRTIQVRAERPTGGRLAVRTRAGYYAPLSPHGADAGRSRP
jgi:Ca-activated chloride channel homolog